jgi:hypothetical protein
MVLEDDDSLVPITPQVDVTIDDTASVSVTVSNRTVGMDRMKRQQQTPETTCECKWLVQ